MVCGTTSLHSSHIDNIMFTTGYGSASHRHKGDRRSEEEEEVDPLLEEGGGEEERRGGGAEETFFPREARGGLQGTQPPDEFSCTG